MSYVNNISGTDGEYILICWDHNRARGGNIDKNIKNIQPLHFVLNNLTILFSCLTCPALHYTLACLYSAGTFRFSAGNHHFHRKYLILCCQAHFQFANSVPVWTEISSSINVSPTTHPTGQVSGLPSGPVIAIQIVCASLRVPKYSLGVWSKSIKSNYCTKSTKYIQLCWSGLPNMGKCLPPPPHRTNSKGQHTCIRPAP